MKNFIQTDLDVSLISNASQWSIMQDDRTKSAELWRFISWY